MVSAWLEPPSVIPAEWPVERTAGARSERNTELASVTDASSRSHYLRQRRHSFHMPLYWLCYRHNNQISVVIEPAPPRRLGPSLSATS